MAHCQLVMCSSCSAARAQDVAHLPLPPESAVTMPLPQRLGGAAEGAEEVVPPRREVPSSSDSLKLAVTRPSHPPSMPEDCALSASSA